MTTYHKHHIVPRHMGGSDDPSNIAHLTIEEHAEAHRILWEEHGHKQDYYAWKGLSGSIEKEEIIIGLISHPGESNPFYGKKHSKETKEKMSAAKKEFIHRIWKSNVWKEKTRFIREKQKRPFCKHAFKNV